MTVDPVYRWLVPRVVAPLAAALGRPAWTTARELATLQWRSSDELETRAVRRLRVLAEHAARHVPYYRSMFAEAGFDPRHIRTLDALAHLPISTKAQLRASFPDQTTAANIPAGRRQRKEQEKMQASLKRGSKVLTASGIVGTVVTLKDGDDEVVIRSEDARIRVKRNTIHTVIGTDDAEAAK